MVNIASTIQPHFLREKPWGRGWIQSDIWNKIVTAFQFVLEILELFWNIYLKISYFFEFHFENLINTFFHLILKIDEIFPDAFFPHTYYR